MLNFKTNNTMTKTAEVVNTLIENFDYDKFVKENKEEMNKLYRVPLGGLWTMGDTEMTNAKYIQKRVQLMKKYPNSPGNGLWKYNIIELIARIKAGNEPKDTDLTEEKRKKFAERGM